MQTPRTIIPVADTDKKISYLTPSKKFMSEYWISRSRKKSKQITDAQGWDDQIDSLPPIPSAGFHVPVRRLPDPAYAPCA